MSSPWTFRSDSPVETRSGSSRAARRASTSMRRTLRLVALENGGRDLHPEAPGYEDDVPHLVDDTASREILGDRLDHVVGGLEDVRAGIDHAFRHVARYRHGRRGDLDGHRRREPPQGLAH